MSSVPGFAFNFNTKRHPQETEGIGLRTVNIDMPLITSDRSNEPPYIKNSNVEPGMTDGRQSPASS